MFLLDTDTLSHLHMGHARAAQRLRETEDTEIATTIVTKAEILSARFEFLMKAADGEQVLRAQSWLQQSERFLADIIVVPFDERAAAEFDRLRQRRKLKQVGHADLLIAAIALAQRATLVTRTLRHFRQIPRLKLENWVD